MRAEGRALRCVLRRSERAGEQYPVPGGGDGDRSLAYLDDRPCGATHERGAADTGEDATDHRMRAHVADAGVELGIGCVDGPIVHTRDPAPIARGNSEVDAAAHHRGEQPRSRHPAARGNGLAHVRVRERDGRRDERRRCGLDERPAGEHESGTVPVPLVSGQEAHRRVDVEVRSRQLLLDAQVVEAFEGDGSASCALDHARCGAEKASTRRCSRRTGRDGEGIATTKLHHIVSRDTEAITARVDQPDRARGQGADADHEIDKRQAAIDLAVPSVQDFFIDVAAFSFAGEADDGEPVAARPHLGGQRAGEPVPDLVRRRLPDRHERVDVGPRHERPVQFQGLCLVLRATREDHGHGGDFRRVGGHANRGDAVLRRRGGGGGGEGVRREGDGSGEQKGDGGHVVSRAPVKGLDGVELLKEEG